MSAIVGTQQQQLLICASESQRERAQALFPKLEARYVNGGDWSSVEGRRCVCLGEGLAHFAVGYAAEVKILPETIPDEITKDTALAWAKANAKLYSLPAKATNPAPAVADVVPPGAIESAGNVEQQVEVPPAPKGAYTDAPPQAAGPDRHEWTVNPLGGKYTAEGGAEWTESRQPSAEPPPFHDTDFPPEALETRPAQPEGWIPPHSDMGEPVDLWGSEEALPVIPPECYPAPIAAYIADEAEQMGCDPGMLAMYCVAICAGCISDEIRLQVKSQSDRWQEPARLWAMVVGDSGLTMKSPSLDVAISHAWKIERELRVNGAQALKDYAIECQIFEAQKAEYVKKRAKNEAAEMPPEPPLPISERLIIGNATLEAIADVLLLQGERGALVVADELLGIISGMNQYKGGKGSDRQDWLEMWNGGPHPIDRKGRAVLVKNWGVSIIGGTQPEAIARVGPELETDGLLQRFLVYLPRHSQRSLDRTTDANARRRYHDLLDRLVKLVRAPDLAPVRFAPEAAPVMEEMREWVFSSARASWLTPGLRSHIAKWPAIMARLCLTYAAIEWADEHHASAQAVIPESVARQVYNLMRGPLWVHAQHFYLKTLLGEHSARGVMRQLGGLILAEGMTDISTRTMAQRSSAYRAASSALRREAVIGLCDMGWIEPKAGGYSTIGAASHYKVNKRVHEVFKEVAAQERAKREGKAEAWRAAKEAKAAREPGED